MTTEPKLVRAPRAEQVAGEVLDRAVDKALGDKVSDETKRAIRTQLAPWASNLVRWLDEVIRIPGTDIHVGLDAVIGLLVPGAGDAITGFGSAALLLLALKEKVPTVAIGRMLLNILVDTVVGAVPVLGDAFDVVWRSNRKNLEIIETYRNDPKAEPSRLDYALVSIGFGLIALSIAIPVALAAIFGFSIGAWLGA